jgi:hypothetical protein
MRKNMQKHVEKNIWREIYNGCLEGYGGGRHLI